MGESLLEDQIVARASMVDALNQDLFGPTEIDEVLSEPPLTKYMTGILYPNLPDTHAPPLAADDERDETADDDGGSPADPAVAMSNVQYPTSAGVSFAVELGTENLLVYVEAARYQQNSDKEWVRAAFDFDPVPIKLDPGKDDHVILADGLKLYWRTREPFEEGHSVTVVLINQFEAEQGKKDAFCFYQVSFSVGASDGKSAPFVTRPSPLSINDEDLETSALLYRNTPEFAVGHGCAGNWQASDLPTKAREISATFMPEYDVTLLESNRNIEDSNLAFEILAESEKHDLVDSLETFVYGYSDWIDGVQDEVRDLAPRFLETGENHVEACQAARDRVLAGVHTLRDDPRALRAFRLANRAMSDQMKRPSGHELAQQPKWRPFQLAFVLLSIPSIVDREHQERELVELLWFPTGGGKTEAYLGLFAFTVFFRRMENPDAGGVTALMRYTLRLLTIQQFSRAAKVVCACELIRKSEGDLGGEAISIGLFVGKASTPNSFAQTQEALTRIRAGNIVSESNPCQLSSCPWCDSPLAYQSYTTLKDPDRLQITCRNDGCEFSASKSVAGLPIFVVDQDLFRVRPTLVIGTVDKFAGLPWNPQIGSLLNSRTSDPPPELIIQDELHLISGPLGTMAALYETAVDLICEAQGSTPKIVSSTATIRRAKSQSRGLFARGVAQFPPPGIDPGDSWFAVEAPGDRVGTRKYLGVMAPGTSHSSLMIRTYASLLNQAGNLPPGETTDPYWTLIGYFNSLRVLGAARMQVQDDVQEWLNILGGERVREIREPIELTSRAQSTDIPGYLDQMEIAMPDPDALDVVLATNMISVGVDVDRLGLMAVMGQPQASAEYIQSTSRVGRKHPGLVITILNAARSRDRSHYEGFRGFHSTLYRSVEATSVTPFSPRARDRGLHAVLVALARQKIPALSENSDASDAPDYEDELRLIRDQILARVQVIDDYQTDGVRDELNAIVDHWIQLAKKSPQLVYQKKNDSEVPLLSEATPEAMASTTEPFSTMRSLRDVDVESELVFASLK